MPRLKKGAPIEGTGSTSLRDLGLTLVQPFFGETKRLERLRSTWASWSDDVKKHIKIIIVDDHGTPSIEDLISQEEVVASGLNLAIYRIQDDLKYNTPGALNLGCMAAATPWILTMDSDCTFEAEVIQRLLDFKPEHDRLYTFFRNRQTSIEVAAQNKSVLPCTILMHKDLFLEVNGFDEDFTGHWSVKHTYKGVPGYGIFDNAFHGRLRDDLPYTCVNQEGYIATEWMEDTVGDRVDSNYWERALNKRVWRAKQRGEIPYSTDMLRFKWKRVRNAHN